MICHLCELTHSMKALHVCGLQHTHWASACYNHVYMATKLNSYQTCFFVYIIQTDRRVVCILMQFNAVQIMCHITVLHVIHSGFCFVFVLLLSVCSSRVQICHNTQYFHYYHSYFLILLMAPFLMAPTQELVSIKSKIKKLIVHNYNTITYGYNCYCQEQLFLLQNPGRWLPSLSPTLVFRLFF